MIGSHLLLTRTSFGLRVRAAHQRDVGGEIGRAEAGGLTEAEARRLRPQALGEADRHVGEAAEPGAAFFTQDRAGNAGRRIKGWAK